MVRSWLSAFYRSIPVIRELVQIRERLSAIDRSIVATRTLEAIRIADFELEAHPRYRDPRRLHRYAFQVSSQNGEDGMIHEIFRRIGTAGKIFVEIGVGDGTENNTAFLLSQAWKGYWIDGSSDSLKEVGVRGGPISTNLQSMVSFVTRENIGEIFKAMGIPEEFDLLSIDIDQNTYFIWEALVAFRPRIVVIEYNSSLPPDVEWKARYEPNRCWDRTQNFGASLKAYENLGRRLGYSLVGCDFVGVNAFFVRDDLIGDHFVRPFSAENHYEPSRLAFIHRRGHRRSILDLGGNDRD